MPPTYSVSEIKLLIRTLDIASIAILAELVEEEKDSFTEYELKAIARFMILKNRQIAGNEVKPEFLLSFN